MPTNAEITTFLCREVLGWRIAPEPEDEWLDIEGYYRVTPEFLTWVGFGLLIEALVKAKKEVVVNGNEFGAIARVGPYTNPGVDPDPKRALMLAAARACGMEGV